MATNVPQIIEPYGIDAALAPLQLSVATLMPWLGNVYGEAELLTRGTGRARERIFAAYAAQGAGSEHEYVELMPRTDLPGFCFFYVNRMSASDLVTGAIKGLASVQADVDVVLFWNYKEAFPADSQQRTVRHVEQLLTQALISTQMYGMTVELGNVVTDFQEVFRPASLSQTDEMTMRRPYGCMKMNMELIFKPYSLNC